MTSRQKAIAAGREWYNSNKPCKNGHLTLRRVTDGKCIDCIKKYQRLIVYGKIYTT